VTPPTADGATTPGKWDHSLGFGSHAAKFVLGKSDAKLMLREV